MTQKEFLRKQVLADLAEIDEEDFKKRSRQLADRLFARKEWQEAKLIATTVSNYPEIETNTIILKALQDGKQVALPRTCFKSKEMVFKKYHMNDELEKKKMGLLEPLELAETVSDNCIDLLIVPGIVFNKNHDRIGFGGGFYDRFLKNYQKTSISLCLKEQYKDFNSEVHDIPVDILIKEISR